MDIGVAQMITLLSIVFFGLLSLLIGTQLWRNQGVRTPPITIAFCLCITAFTTSIATLTVLQRSTIRNTSQVKYNELVEEWREAREVRIAVVQPGNNIVIATSVATGKNIELYCNGYITVPGDVFETTVFKGKSLLSLKKPVKEKPKMANL